jgi:hypothetical protein
MAEMQKEKAEHDSATVIVMPAPGVFTIFASS